MAKRASPGKFVLFTFQCEPHVNNVNNFFQFRQKDPDY